MAAKQIFYEKQLQFFLSQDPEKAFFDVVFEIDGKKLYADKFRLAAISETFQVMLSERWTSKDEPIKIKDYNFDDFKEFLTFIYSGECQFTNENIYTMVDIAEFYNIDVLKDMCEDYLLEMECSNKNILKLLDLAYKYSMINLKENLFEFVVENFSNSFKSDKFLTLDELTIKEFVIFAEKKVMPEEIFKAVCLWAEHQALLKEEDALTFDNFILRETIKNELSEILPHIQFRKMSLEFLHKFVVLKAYVFPSLKELSDILCYVSSFVTVKVTSSNGQMLQGTISRDDPAVETVKSLKNTQPIFSEAKKFFIWETHCKKPSTQSQIVPSENSDWYLVYFCDGYFGLQHRLHLKSYHFIIAEMHCENAIKEADEWKIDIN